MTSMMTQVMQMTAEDHCLLILPLFHANALMVSLLSPLRVGARLSIVGTFSASTFFDRVEQLRPTFFSAVPTIYALLLTQAEGRDPDMSSLRFAVCGAAPATRELLDRATAEVWFGWARRRPPLHTSSIAPVVTSVPRARIAFGAPAAGIDGFRTTRAQAARAATIARVSTAPAAHVVSYADDGIPIVARLAEDLPATRRWVGEVLGPLARDTADAARQRETIRVFLESAENYSDTAARLLLHRNTVKYRLTKAEDELGRAPGERRMDTQLALTTCHLLGGAVLTPTTATGAGA